MNGAMRILIGYDGSEGADAALDDLQRAGLPEEAEAHIVSVAELWFIEHNPAAYEAASSSYESGIKEAEDLAQRAIKRVHARFPNWSLSPRALTGSPTEALLAEAGEWKPDMIVIGSHGRSALGRLIFGSVSQKLVTEAPCSVRVARGNLPLGNPGVRILIGVDGSPDAEEAVRSVAGRNWPEGSEARIVTSIDSPFMNRPPTEDYLNHVRELQARAGAELEQAGLSYSTAIKEVNPKRALVEEAKEWDADSIFIGARDIRKIEGMMLGSVSAAVASRAHCSVEVVREARASQG